jgi:hypothetical protein
MGKTLIYKVFNGQAVAENVESGNVRIQFRKGLNEDARGFPSDVDFLQFTGVAHTLDLMDGDIDRVALETAHDVSGGASKV